MRDTTLRRLLYVVGLFAFASAWIGLAVVTDRLSPYARGWVDGGKSVLLMGTLVAIWRARRAARHRAEVELAGREARWLPKHPDAVVGGH